MADDDGERIAKRRARERIRVLFQGRNNVINIGEDQIIEPFVDEINAYVDKLQADRRPNPQYLVDVQTGIAETMRAQIVNWLIGVSNAYNLLPESVCLAVAYFDRYLSQRATGGQSLQMFAAASLMIAAKYEEYRPTPSTANYCSMAGDSFTVSNLVRAEDTVLHTLGYALGDPTVMTFLRKFTKVAHSQREFQTSNLTLQALIQYLAELSLVEYSLLQFWPNMIAAAITYLARFSVMPRLHPWNQALQQLSGFRPAELRGCIEILHDLQSGRRGGNLDLVKNKFNSRKFRYVTRLTRDEIPDMYFEDI